MDKVWEAQVYFRGEWYIAVIFSDTKENAYKIMRDCMPTPEENKYILKNIKTEEKIHMIS